MTSKVNHFYATGFTPRSKRSLPEGSNRSGVFLRNYFNNSEIPKSEIPEVLAILENCIESNTNPPDHKYSSQMCACLCRIRAWESITKKTFYGSELESIISNPKLYKNRNFYSKACSVGARPYDDSEFEEIETDFNHQNFNPQWLPNFYQEVSDFEDYSFIPVESDPDALDEFRDSVTSILSTIKSFKYITREEVLYSIDNTLTFDPLKNKKEFKLSNDRVRNSIGICKYESIPVGFCNKRDGFILNTEGSKWISWLDANVRSVLEEIPESAMHHDFEVSKSRVSSLTRYLDFIMIDLKKEGLTKPRILLKIMLEELRKKFDFEVFNPEGYEDLQVIKDGKIVTPLRGHGLGMANGLTTLMHIAVWRIIRTRLKEIDETFRGEFVAYNDDSALGCTSSLSCYRIIDLFYSFYRRLGHIINLKKSLFSRKGFFFCETYFERSNPYPKEKVFTDLFLFYFSDYGINEFHVYLKKRALGISYPFLCDSLFLDKKIRRWIPYHLIENINVETILKEFSIYKAINKSENYSVSLIKKLLSRLDIKYCTSSRDYMDFRQRVSLKPNRLAKIREKVFFHIQDQANRIFSRLIKVEKGYPYYEIKNLSFYEYKDFLLENEFIMPDNPKIEFETGLDKFKEYEVIFPDHNTDLERILAFGLISQYRYQELKSIQTNEESNLIWDWDDPWNEYRIVIDHHPKMFKISHKNDYLFWCQKFDSYFIFDHNQKDYSDWIWYSKNLMDINKLNPKNIQYLKRFWNLKYMFKYYIEIKFEMNVELPELKIDDNFEEEKDISFENMKQTIERLFRDVHIMTEDQQKQILQDGFTFIDEERDLDEKQLDITEIQRFKLLHNESQGDPEIRRMEIKNFEDYIDYLRGFYNITRDEIFSQVYGEQLSDDENEESLDCAPHFGDTDSSSDDDESSSS